MDQNQRVNLIVKQLLSNIDRQHANSPVTKTLLKDITSMNPNGMVTRDVDQKRRAVG